MLDFANRYWAWRKRNSLPPHEVMATVEGNVVHYFPSRRENEQYAVVKWSILGLFTHYCDLASPEFAWCRTDWCFISCLGSIGDVEKQFGKLVVPEVNQNEKELEEDPV